MKRIIAFLLTAVVLLAAGTPITGTPTAAADEGPYVRTAFEKFNGVTLDGTITEEEWGEPVIITDPAHAQTTWSAFYVTEGSARDYDQKLKVYMTNDKSYIYIGVTLDKSDFDSGCATATRTELMKYAHLDFTLGKYDATTGIENFTYNSVIHERYVKFTLGWVNGTPTCVASALGTTNTNLTASDFSLRYDAEAKTYTYEVRVPFSIMTLNQKNVQDIAVSMNVGTTKTTTASAFSNRYNLTLGAANSGAAGSQAHKNQTMKMTLNNVWTLSPYVRTEFMPYNGIVLDGTITEEEWGEPVIVTDPAHAQTTWGAFYVTEGAARNYDQELKVYMVNDKSHIYIGVTLDESTLDAGGASATRGELMKYAHLDFTLAKYDPDTTVENFLFNEQVHERYVKFTLGWVGGQPVCVASALGTTNTNLAESDYSIRYDASTRTYIYEVRVPISITTLAPDTTTDIAVSMNVGTSKTTTGSAFSNRYNLTLGAANSGAAGAQSHKNQAMRMSLVSVWEDLDTYVRDQAEAYRGVTIDGTITESEWGEPVIMTTPGHTAENWTFHVTEPTYRSMYQQAKVYLTNDNDYIYVGVTLDVSDLDTTSTTATLGQMTLSAHMNFTIAQYNEDTTVPRTVFNEQEHESFTRVTMGLLNGTDPTCLVSAQGFSVAAAEAGDYSITYDAKTRTYTYEVRVPFSKTNIDPTADMDMALSMSIGCTKNTAASAFTNRYLITSAALTAGGAGNFAHQDNALKFTLNDDERRIATYIRDHAETFNGITLDGAITESEWGEPIALTTPGDSQRQWGGYYIYEPGYKEIYQTVKVYMTNDTDYIYIGCTVDRCDLDTSCTEATTQALMNAAHLSFTLSTYNADTTVPHIFFQDEEYEQYAKFTLGLVNGVTPVCTANAQGRTSTNLDPADYRIKYDADTRTYTYEVRVPYSSTNIDLYSNLDVALSLNVGTTKYTTESTSSNRINLTTCANSAGGAYNYAHQDKALKITLNDDPNRVATYVRDRVAGYRGVTIDGYVSDTEWGEPVIVTMPGHCQTTWGAFWRHNPTAVDNSQVARVYVTNDDTYIYFAATLDKSDFDDNCTTASTLHNYAHFRLTLSAYDEQTTYSHVRSLKSEWEQYSCYMLGFVNGQPAIHAISQKIDVFALDDSDWAVRYDAATRTYFYEIRIPYDYTTFALYDTDVLAASLSIGCASVPGSVANRYNMTIGQATCSGAENFAHTNNALVLKMNAFDSSKSGRPLNPSTGDISVWMVCGMGAVPALTGGWALLRRRQEKRRCQGQDAGI